MAGQSTASEQTFAELLADERPRLIGLCAYLSHDAAAAEDLAQETLTEAWRHRHKLADPAGAALWLNAIARHVCRRWRRQQVRALLAQHLSEDAPPLEHPISDLEVALERGELADLLDRALALLPPETRSALLLRYVALSPHAEIAARLGLSTGAVAVRVHRGRLALRRLLLTRFRDETLAWGLLERGAGNWQETRLWCPECGQHRLRGRLCASPPAFEVRCPRCSADPASTICRNDDNPVVVGARGIRDAYTRAMAWGHRYYRGILAEPFRQTAPCWRCGAEAPLLRRFPPRADIPYRLHGLPGIYIRCPHCGELASTTARALALHLPQGQQFWRDHPRIRLLPTREVEAEGLTAAVTSLLSLPDSARLDVVWVQETFQVLAIHGARPADARDADATA